MSGENQEGMVVRQSGAVADSSLSVNEVTQQIQHIQQIMKNIMKEGEHYGTIPGCGDKPSLLQSGAQKIALAFRLIPSYVVEREDMPGEHREYEITCNLSSPTGEHLGSGVGCATTMETKFRYRTASTGEEVPKDYWQTRDSSLLGGSQYSTRKVDGTWMIMEKIDHDNPADYYNTVKKMAKKRAYVDAVTNTTACSDIFTQDLEDLKDNGVVDDNSGTATPTQEPMKKPEAAKSKATPKGGKTITEKQGKLIYAKCKGKDMSDEEMKALIFGVSGVQSSKEVKMSDMDAMIEAIDGWTREVVEEPESSQGDAYEEELPL